MEVWVLGDLRYMYEVFNAIAMITGHNDWLAVIRIGMLVGILMIGLSAILSQKLELQHFLYAWIVYAVMFVPRTDVLLIDAYDDTQIMAVDNVPTGVAMVASFISKAGRGMTELMEQAFQPVDPSQTTYEGIIAGGYLDPLKQLIEMRSTVYGTQSRALHFNLTEYLTNCTAQYLKTHELNVTDIMNAANAWTAARAPSPLLSTQWMDGSATIIERTCAEADTDLNNTLTSASHESILTKAVAEKVGISDPTQVLDRLEGPMKAIGGAGADAYGYMFNAIMLNYLTTAGDAATARSNDMTYAYIVQSARERRDLTHAAEKTLFEDIMRPLMAFFEAFMFAITPLMAFMLVMGPASIKFASKYLLMTVWIQLWLPIFSIIKLYTYLTMNGEMAAMQVHGLTPNSIEWAWAYQQMVQHWLGISGWLSAATPTIALSLVYGGAITANSIAGNMQRVAQQSAAQAAHTFTPGLMTVGPSGVQIGDRNLQPQMMPAGAGGIGWTHGQAAVQTESAGALSFAIGQSTAAREALSHATSARDVSMGQMMTQYALSKEGQHAIGSSLEGGVQTKGSETRRFDAIYNKLDGIGYNQGLRFSEEEKNMIGAAGSAGVNTPFFSAAIRTATESAMQRAGITDAATKADITYKTGQAVAATVEDTKHLSNSFNERDMFSQANRWAKTEQSGKGRELANAYQKADEIASGLQRTGDFRSTLQFGNLDRTASLLNDPNISNGHDLAGELMRRVDANPREALDFVKSLYEADPNSNWRNIAGALEQHAKYQDELEGFKDKLPSDFGSMVGALNQTRMPDVAVPEAPSFRGQVAGGMNQDASDAGKNRPLVPTRDQLWQEQRHRSEDPNFPAEIKGMYQQRGQEAIQQLEQVVGMQPTPGAVAKMLREGVDQVFPENRDTARHLVNSYQQQHRGLGVQIAAFAMSQNPDNNIDTSKLDLSDTKQQLTLGRRPDVVGRIVGNENATTVANAGNQVAELTKQFFMTGDEGSKLKLQEKLTELAGSEEGGLKAMSALSRAGNEVLHEQDRGIAMFLTTKGAPDAGILQPGGAQSGDGKKLFNLASATEADTYYSFNNSSNALGKILQDPMGLNDNYMKRKLDDWSSDKIYEMAASDSGGLNKGDGVSGEDARNYLEKGHKLLTGAILGDETVLRDTSPANMLKQWGERLNTLDSPGSNPFSGTHYENANAQPKEGVFAHRFDEKPGESEKSSEGPSTGVRSVPTTP